MRVRIKHRLINGYPFFFQFFIVFSYYLLYKFKAILRIQTQNILGLPSRGYSVSNSFLNIPYFIAAHTGRRSPFHIAHINPVVLSANPIAEVRVVEEKYFVPVFV
jgi:hypothetical protein